MANKKRGIKRSREAIRKWVLKLRKRPKKRESKKQRKKKPRPIKLSPESRVKRLPHIPIEKKLLKRQLTSESRDFQDLLCFL